MEVLKKPIALDETLQEVVGQLNDLNNKILIAKGDSFEYEDFTPEQLEALKGAKGDKGDDGFSPIATVTKSGNKSTISITDADGTTTAEVLDGKDGKDGYTPIKGKDYFDGEKGDDYVITSADYEAIAERTKDLVPPYDDTELREEIHRTDDRLDALWKINEGQTYDVLESASEDYTKVVPSGSHYASVDVVGGKSVVWNQLWGNRVGVEPGVSYTELNGIYHVTKSTTAGNGLVSYHKTVVGHKYYLSFTARSNSDDVPLTLSLGTAVTINALTSNWEKKRGIVAVSSSRSVIYIYSATQAECEYEHTTPIVIDLTQMFGAGNEPTSVDDPRIKAIEEYALAHPQYNSGEIISSQTDAVAVQGANIFDESLLVTNSGFTYLNGEYVGTNKSIRERSGQILRDVNAFEPNTQYTLTVTYKDNSSKNTKFGFAYTDGTFSYSTSVGSSYETRTITSSIGKTVVCGLTDYGDVGTITVKSLQVEKGTTATSYSPYRKETIPTSFPTLRSAGSIYDYIDLNKGELHRRVGVVDDISTLNFDVVPYYSELTGNSVFAIKMPRDSKGYNSWATCEAMCVDSVAKPYNAKDLYVLWNNTSQTDLTVAFPNGTTMQNVIEHYSGMPLYYELAEETIEPITIPSDLTEWLECEANGTITFVNEQKLLVPNTERFIRKLNEVT